MGRPYYSKIAKAWHAVTGPEGGALKKHVLNRLVMTRLGPLDGLAVLELGAGNGYFMKWLLDQSGSGSPSRLVITEASGALLALARESFPLPTAEYHQLDVRRPFPFTNDSFDRILAVMVFNELRDRDYEQALRECARVLKPGGMLVAVVTHPDFIDCLQRQGKLTELSPGFFTMPGKDALRVPVIPRTMDAYRAALVQAGFRIEQEPVYPTEDVLRERPGLRHADGLPLAAVFTGIRLPAN